MNKSEKNETLFPYISRDLSWADFNARVLNEGLKKDLPLLERLRFLSIVSSNFDEFFMVRVAALKRMGKAGKGAAADPAGLTPAQQLKAISEKARAIIKKQYECINNEIFPGLAKKGLCVLKPESCSIAQMDFLDAYFVARVYPVLTPLRIEDDKPLPFIENRSIHAAFLLEPEAQDKLAAQDGKEESPVELKAIIPLPPELNRIIWLPAAKTENQFELALLEDVVIAWGAYLFPGYKIKESMLFKINRDADFSVDERRDEDFVEAMEEVLEDRDRSEVVRMVYSPGSKTLRDELAKRFLLEEDYLYEVDGPINAADFMELANVAGLEDLSEKPWKIYESKEFSEEALQGTSPAIWDIISAGDIMLHLPYQSFDPVARFFREAAEDPQVIAIKTALYRTSGAIPRALEQAALNGKQVTAIVELKARFDEERNISWANRLEKAGVIVVYGLSRLKVHSKISMVMRRENDRIKRYAHISTGNYNDRTAKYYEDICFFTCREDIAYDTGLLFNMLTGYSAIQQMARLVVAPKNLKRVLLELIEREAERAGSFGKIIAKMNALTDVDIINALYKASGAGVKIYLCVRGICALVPGVEGVSENIKVISVIDHYLEHSRIYYFANGGAEELYLASADWMPRNLERRVELMFPVLDEKPRAELLDTLNCYFRDNCNSFALDKNGNWTQIVPDDGEKPFRIQKEMLARAEKASETAGPVKLEYNVRRKT